MEILAEQHWTSNNFNSLGVAPVCIRFLVVLNITPTQSGVWEWQLLSQRLNFILLLYLNVLDKVTVIFQPGCLSFRIFMDSVGLCIMFMIMC